MSYRILCNDEDGDGVCNGLETTVTGVHIERWHTHKPLWMYELEHPNYPTANRSEREVKHYPPSSW